MWCNLFCVTPKLWGPVLNLRTTASQKCEAVPRRLAFEAHRPLYHSILGMRVIKKKKRSRDLGSPPSGVQRKSVWRGTLCLQGYLAHKKQRPPRALQKDYAYGPMVVLGERLFLLSEVRT